MPQFSSPPTPNSELARALKTIADSEAEAGVHFKILETGGISMKSVLQKSNPLRTAGCDNLDCLPCNNKRGEGETVMAVGSTMSWSVSCARQGI